VRGRRPTTKGTKENNMVGVQKTRHCTLWFGTSPAVRR